MSRHHRNTLFIVSEDVVFCLDPLSVCCVGLYAVMIDGEGPDRLFLGCKKLLNLYAFCVQVQDTERHGHSTSQCCIVLSFRMHFVIMWLQGILSFLPSLFRVMLEMRFA